MGPIWKPLGRAAWSQARAPQGLGRRDHCSAGWRLAPHPPTLAGRRLPPPGPLLPLPPPDVGGAGGNFCLEPPVPFPLPASSAVMLKMGSHSCQIARWGSDPPFLLISGLSACVLEIPAGSWELSLLLELEVLNACACNLLVTLFWLSINTVQKAKR